MSLWIASSFKTAWVDRLLLSSTVYLYQFLLLFVFNP